MIEDVKAIEVLKMDILRKLDEMSIEQLQRASKLVDVVKGAA